MVLVSSRLPPDEREGVRRVAAIEGGIGGTSGTLLAVGLYLVIQVTFLGWLSDLFKRLSDLQLGDKKATLNHLVFNISWDQNLLDFESWTTRTLTKNMKPM